MKQIEKCDLGLLAADVEEQERQRQVEAAKKALHYMYLTIDTHESAVRRLREQLSAEEKKLEAAKTRLEKAKAGDWNVLPKEDEMNKKEGK